MHAPWIAAALIVGLSAFPHGQAGAAEGGPATKAFPAAPTPLSAQDQKRYEEATNLIQICNASGDILEKAYQILMDLAQRNQKSGYPIAGLAELKYMLAMLGGGSVQEAYILAQRAISLDPNIADAYVVMAKVMIAQGNVFAAQEAADRAIALAPQKPEAMFVKARVAERGSRYDEAEQWYRQSIDRHTDRERKANIYHWLGEMFRSKKPRDVPRATAAYEKVAEFAEDRSVCVLNAAGIFFAADTDRYDTAIKILNRALKANEGSEAARVNLGLAMYYKWGDAYVNPAKYKDAKQKPDDPKTIAAKTGVSPEYAFSMNPVGPRKPWATIAMLRTGMIKDVDVVVPGASGTALTAAAFGNHLDVVKMLVAKGANVNAEDNDNRETAIFYAVANNNLEMVKFLVEKGARVNRVDGNKRPLVARAVDNAALDDIRILSYLLERGADPSLPDQNGNPLIAVAVMNGNPAAARLLLQKYKADPNTKLSGNPVLVMAAVSSGPSRDTVKALLEAGANPWVKYGPDVLSVLSSPQMNPKAFPSAKDNFEMILEARKSTQRPADFGRAYGEK